MAGKNITSPPQTYDAHQWRQIIRDIELRFAALESAVGNYEVTNFTPTRTLDAGAATATDVANFVATLVSDMQKAGRLGS